MQIYYPGSGRDMRPVLDIRNLKRLMAEEGISREAGETWSLHYCDPDADVADYFSRLAQNLKAGFGSTITEEPLRQFMTTTGQEDAAAKPTSAVGKTVSAPQTGKTDAARKATEAKTAPATDKSETDPQSGEADPATYVGDEARTLPLWNPGDLNVKLVRTFMTGDDVCPEPLPGFDWYRKQYRITLPDDDRLNLNFYPADALTALERILPATAVRIDTAFHVRLFVSSRYLTDNPLEPAAFFKSMENIPLWSGVHYLWTDMAERHIPESFRPTDRVVIGWGQSGPNRLKRGSARLYIRM